MFVSISSLTSLIQSGYQAKIYGCPSGEFFLCAVNPENERLEYSLSVKGEERLYIFKQPQTIRKFLIKHRILKPGAEVAVALKEWDAENTFCKNKAKYQRKLEKHKNAQ